jgi:hypothetical protein
MARNDDSEQYARLKWYRAMLSGLYIGWVSFDACSDGGEDTEEIVLARKRLLCASDCSALMLTCDGGDCLGAQTAALC